MPGKSNGLWRALEKFGTLRKLRSAREHYTEDKKSGRFAVAADLQKVLILPNMNQHKTAIFTP